RTHNIAIDIRQAEGWHRFTFLQRSQTSWRSCCLYACSRGTSNLYDPKRSSHDEISSVHLYSPLAHFSEFIHTQRIEKSLKSEISDAKFMPIFGVRVLIG